MLQETQTASGLARKATLLSTEISVLGNRVLPIHNVAALAHWQGQWRHRRPQLGFERFGRQRDLGIQ